SVLRCHNGGHGHRRGRGCRGGLLQRLGGLPRRASAPRGQGDEAHKAGPGPAPRGCCGMTFATRDTVLIPRSWNTSGNRDFKYSAQATSSPRTEMFKSIVVAPETAARSRDFEAWLSLRPGKAKDQMQPESV